MFKNRPNQKPSDELYRSFKANFPQLHAAGTTSSSTATEPVVASSSLTEALDMPFNARHADLHTHDLKDSDPTPRASHDAWNFGTSGLTPSMMDPNSHSFNMFANQMPGYYTPTPGGTNTLYHNQAGDLHTPNFAAAGLGTPLSMPTSEGTLHAGQQAAFQQQYHQSHLPQHLQQPVFQHVNPFQMHHNQPQQSHAQNQQQQSFPPHHFTNHSSFESMDGAMGQSPVDDMGLDVHMSQTNHSPEMLFHHPHPTSTTTMQPPPAFNPGESFRYHVTLNAPTAMVKSSDEIPITYLNKGQAYTLNVADTHRRHFTPGTKYRTFIRVSFEDEHQRSKPGACWQLWKEGRGTNEAHQRGGRLQAVEYVDAGQITGAEDPSKPRVDIESASFDGFCVVWSPAPTGTAECPISVRFNFLSTDFSHSKGVKGIPVRLCAKTELLGETAPDGSPPSPEVCYCKVKLFRDHGAERKLSNDIAHIKKTIDKLNQQLAQIGSGLKDPSKRKRASIAANLPTDERPGKVPKHKRTWSLSSVTSTGGRGSAEDDLHAKLMTLQDMFTSTRPASVLHLRGAEEDDPDLHPVVLSGEQSLPRTDSGNTQNWERQSMEDPSDFVSPTPSNHSVAGPRRDSTLQQPTPRDGASRTNSSDWRNNPQTATMDLQPPATVTTALGKSVSSPEDNPIKIQTRSPTSGTLTRWVESLGVDPAYQAPPDRVVKPVAVFYARRFASEKQQTDNFHRAVYIMNRTIKDFVNALASKFNVEPTKVLRTVRYSSGLQILFDDECIRELPEGQDLLVEFADIHDIDATTSSRSAQREWDAGSTDIQCDGDVPTTENMRTSGYELRLHF